VTKTNADDFAWSFSARDAELNTIGITRSKKKRTREAKMSADQAMDVFDQRRQTETTAHPNDNDCRIDIRGSNGDWRRITSIDFMTDISPGQVQEVDIGDDVIHARQKDQQVVVMGRHDTTAREQFTISSREDAIFVTAETQIVLAVGDSRIVIKNDGTIEIVCQDLMAKATNETRIVGIQRVDINHPNDMDM
jgi:hypothetical protein